jgi:WD40 repeat protein
LILVLAFTNLHDPLILWLLLTPGEFQEIKSHHSSITRLRMTWDEQLLVTASDDGCILVYDVKDKDAKAAARRDQEKMDWAVEVLVTRSELDEKKSRMAELEQQV